MSSSLFESPALKVRLLSKRNLAVLIGAFTIAMGVIVTVGWFVESEALVQIHPSFVPMQTNTALSIAFSGLGALLGALGWRRLGGGVMLAVAAFATATFSQTLFGFNLGLDSLVVEPFTAAKSPYPGRMGANTSVALALIGLAGLIWLRERPGKHWLNAELIFPTLSLAMAGTAFVGYLVGIETAYTWKGLSGMAVHTAVGIGLVSTVVLLGSRADEERRSAMLPVQIGVGGVALSLLLWQALESREAELVDRVELEALEEAQAVLRLSAERLDRAALRLAERSSRLEALGRERWRDASDEVEWLVEARRLMADFTSLTAVRWVDDSRGVDWVLVNSSDTGRSSRPAFRAVKFSALPEGELRLELDAAVFSETTFKHLDGLLGVVVRSADREQVVFSSSPILEGATREALVAEEILPGGYWMEVGLTAGGERVFRSKDGWLVFVSTLGLTIALVAISGVLAESRRNRQRAEQNEKRFISAVDVTPNGVLIVGADGRIQYANAQVELYFGWTREELKGMAIEELVPRESRQTHVGVRSGFVENPSRRMMGHGRELKGLRKDGSTFAVEVGLGSFETEEGRFVIASVFDVQARQEMELERERFTQMLAASNEELERFAYVVSHDLKAPLRGITSISQWMLEDYQDQVDEEGRNWLEQLVSSSQRMSALIDGVLAYSRLGRVQEKWGPVDLAGVAESARKMGDPQSELEVSIADPLPTVFGESTRLEQVFQNLFSNCVKYAAGVDKRVTVSCKELPDCWELRVADRGPGVSEKYARKVFDLFQSVEKERGKDSTGVGLALVKRIVELHGGKVWLEQRDGGGAVFAFTLSKSEKRPWDA